MPKPKLKTVKTDDSVEAFIAGVVDPQRRSDCAALVALLKKATKCEPRMWGVIVGFGDVHYKYESGHEGDTFVLGFSVRKTDFTLYGFGCILRSQADAVERLGKCRTGKGCLYIRRLADIDTDVLSEMLTRAADLNRRASVPLQG